MTKISNYKSYSLRIFSTLLAFLSVMHVAFADAPNAPTNTQASDGTFLDKVQVTWTPPASGPAVDGYRIFRSTTNTPCGGTIVATVANAPTSFNDTTVPSSTQVYYYSVASVSALNEQGLCSAADPGRLQSIDPPLPPANISATQNLLDKITVSWSVPSGSETITSYEIYRSESSVAVCQGSPIASPVVPSLSYDDATATPGIIYYYTMLSVGPNGKSACTTIPKEGFRLLPPPPLPPANVQASDGTFTDKVLVTWQAPVGSTPITSYRLFKSTAPGLATACQTLIQDNIPATTFSANDTIGIIPGKFYYYSMISRDSTGREGQCSVIDPGYAKISAPTNVAASDGTYLDKVQVTWSPPSLPGLPQGDITGYKLYRSITPQSCVELLQTFPSASTLTFPDFAVTKEVLYYYSVKTVSPTGDSDCSIVDPGHSRKILPPANVTATDGTFLDKVVVSWIPPDPSSEVTGFKLYKSPTPLACQNLIQTFTGLSTLSYNDTAVTPGTLYYYSIKTISASGDSVCSVIDSGFAKLPPTVCSDGLDNDTDGLIDLADPGCKGDPTRNTEKDPNGPHCDNGIDDDGDGKIDYRTDTLGDPSCSTPIDGTEDDTDTPLKSPAYIKFNTYLGQWNFAELVNQGTAPKQVDLTLYNLLGQKMISRSYVVPAQSQVDVDVNALLQFACTVLKTNCSAFEDLSAQGVPNGLDRPDGVVDTYGLVELVFTDINPAERLLGRMSFYRPNVDGDYSFAFAREFNNPNKGTSYATANTYDPQASGFLVPNWAEVINLDTVAQSYTVNIFDQDGKLKAARGITLQPLGEFDVQAGHEFIDASGKVVEGVFLVEVIPQNATAPYYLSVSRYSSNSLPGVDPETYNYALSIDGLSGTTDKIFAPIGNTLPNLSGLTDKPSITNWVEVVNVDNITADIVISFRSLAGAVLFSQNYSIPAKGQFHFNAGGLLPKGTTGSVEIKSNAKVVSQGMSYAHGTDNSLQSGFSSVAKPAGAQEQVGTINTFLGMKNSFEIISTVSSPTDVGFKITTFAGATKTGVIGLGSQTNQSFQITDNSTLGITENTYGGMILKSAAAGQFTGEIRRMRVSNGKLDFVMPTGVR